MPLMFTCKNGNINFSMFSSNYVQTPRNGNPMKLGANLVTGSLHTL